MPSVNPDSKGVEEILVAACKAIKLSRARVELSVNIVTPAKMQELNKAHRGKNKPTDVLSFPLFTRDELATMRAGRGILNIGDIFINRVDAKEKLPFLVVHGFLHLMGYDHEISKQEEKEMFALQDEILNHLRN